MEAAASLFGPGDTSSDPFASLIPQDTSTEEPQTHNNAYGTGLTTDVDTNGSNFFDQDAPQHVVHSSVSAVNAVHDAHSYGETLNQAPTYQSQYDGMPEQQNYQPSLANGHGYSNYYTQTTTAQPTTSYEPRQAPMNSYAPTSSSAYQPTAYNQQYTQQTSYDGIPNSSQSTYGYQPPNYNAYAPNGGSNSQYGYGAPTYAPTYPSQQAPPAPPPASNFTVPTPATSTVSAVKPVVRPKVANAYDPPIPAARQNRRPTPRAPSGPQPYNYEAQSSLPVGRMGSPAMANGYQDSLPPPPPRPPQSTYGQTPPPQTLPPPPLRPPQSTYGQTPPPQTLPPPPPRAPSSVGQSTYNSYGGPNPSHDSQAEKAPSPWNQAVQSENALYGNDITPSHANTNGLISSQPPSSQESPDGESSYGHTAAEPESEVPWSSQLSETSAHVSQTQHLQSIPDTLSVESVGYGWAAPTETRPEQKEEPLPSASPGVSYVPGPVGPSDMLPDVEDGVTEQEQASAGVRASAPPVSSTVPVNFELQSGPYAPTRTMSPAASLRESEPPADPYAPTTSSLAHGPPRESQYPTDPYAPRTISPAPGPAHGDSYTPIVHSHTQNGYRTSSPLAMNRLNGSNHASHDKPSVPPPPRADRNRSMSGGSLLSNGSSSTEDPYAPARRTQTLHSSGNLGQFRHASPVHHRGGTPEIPKAQELSVKHALNSHYAPSPSLHGANDPLGRTAARVPIISFGFGGKVVSCFHGADSFSTGFDVALSSRNTTGIRIRNLKSLIPEAQQDNSSTFPGPLYGDPASQGTSLVRTGPNTHTKNKKALVTKYLTGRASELELGLRYLESDSLAYGRANGKLILTKLLKVMVEYDGRLTGTPEIDLAVRTALVPSLETAAEPSTFVTMSDAVPAFGYPAIADQSASGQHISTTTLKASHLEKIEDFLVRGERKKAYHYALDEKLWAHAMVIASSIDKDAWKEVVGEFLKGELGSKSTETSGVVTPGRESLRVVYSLFSGQGPSAIQEFSPQNLLMRATAPNQLQPPTVPAIAQITPKTPNFTAPMQSPPTIASLAKWPETVAMMLASPLPADTAAALTALGDQLGAAQLHEAAHVCYLLSPQTSPLGGIGQPTARVTLVGSKSPQTWSLFSKDQDPFIFSEVVEFALSLSPTIKGQEPFGGIAHLQAYRFIRAASLIDLGDVQQANKYCEAITAAISRTSPYTTPALLEQLKELSDRIAGTTQTDKSFWSGGKISKPSLDTIGGWLEGRFTKLVTGDEEKTPDEEKKNEGREFSGPFNQYSTISSNTPSARSSPQPTHVNPYAIPPPARSGSALAASSPYAYQPVDRASSAMDHVRRKSTPQPVPRATPASSTASSFYNTPSSGSLQSQDELVTPRPPLAGEDDSQSSGSSWWNSTAYDEGPAGKTPTTATFMKVDHGLPESPSSDGFISLMDTHSYSVGPSRPSSEASHRSPVDSYGDDDDDDLGLGNRKPKPKKTETSDTIKPEAKAEEAPKASAVAASPAEKKPEPQQNGSWLSRWWKKSDAPGPVKANLGEQSSFYYDKELKRWVNKNAAAEEPKPATPPPPPSRAQTASPGMTGHHLPPSPGGTPPPARAASAIDLSTSPPSRTVMRVRSNLVPPGAPESAPSTPTGSRLAPAAPPPGRPRSQASKRNIRNRYVDVFSQEAGGGGGGA